MKGIVRHLLINHKDWNKIIGSTRVEEYLINLQLGKDEVKVISKLYLEFLLMNPNNSLHIKERWEAGIQQQISREDWGEICSEAHMVTNANIWREFKWKVITRYFRTPQITAKWSPTPIDKCWRNCGAHIGNHLHIFWSCSKLK